MCSSLGKRLLSTICLLLVLGSVFCQNVKMGKNLLPDIICKANLPISNGSSFLENNVTGQIWGNDVSSGIIKERTSKRFDQYLRNQREKSFKFDEFLFARSSDFIHKAGQSNAVLDTCTNLSVLGGQNSIVIKGDLGFQITVDLLHVSSNTNYGTTTYLNPGDSIVIPRVPTGQSRVRVVKFNSSLTPICETVQFVNVTFNGILPVLSVTDITVDESRGTVNVQVCSSTGVLTETSVIVTTVDSTAKGGQDFVSTSDTVVIVPRQTCWSINFPLINDSLSEPDEFFKVILSNPVNATIGDGEAVIRITDNDPKNVSCDSVKVSTSPRLISIEGLIAPRLLVQVLNSAWVEVFKQVYTNSPGNINIPNLTPGQYYVSVILMQSDWTGICNREFYNVTVPDTAVVRPTVSIGDITVNENDGFASINICVRNARQEYISIGFFTINGTAVGGEDFTPMGVGGSVSLNKDDSCTTIQVRITNDGLTEHDEYFTFAISALRGEVDLLDSTAVITIKDNDENGSPCGTLTIEPGPGSIQVNDLVAPIALVQVSNSSWSVIYNEILRDYNGDLTIPSLSAGNYFVRINLFDANWQFICEKEAYFFVPAGNPLPTLSMNDISFNESVGSTGIQVCLSSPSAQAVTVDYETFPINGSFPSARLGIDYILPAGSITIPAGQTCAIIPLTILNDTLQETTEVFSVRFINVVNALMPDNMGIVTILDDDNCSPGAICVRNSCPASTVNLNTVYSIPVLPPGVVISWHSGPIATIGNQLLPEQVSSVSQSGSYYAALKTSANGSVCYSATIRVDVTIVGCTLNNNAIVVGSSKPMSQINDKIEILRAQPNPFTNSITVWVESERDEKANVSIVDITGRVVTRRSVFLSKGKNSISFENLGNRSSGTYFVNAVTENFNRTIKLVKN